jgi:hypothetical protein
MPEPLSPEMLEHFGSAMTNLASTLHFNMTPNSREKRLERSVFLGEGLPEEYFAEFDVYLRERAHAMLSDVDDWLAEVARRPARNPNARIATGVSVYHYIAPADARLILNKHISSTDSAS